MEYYCVQTSAVQRYQVWSTQVYSSDKIMCEETIPTKSPKIKSPKFRDSQSNHDRYSRSIESTEISEKSILTPSSSSSNGLPYSNNSYEEEEDVNSKINNINISEPNFTDGSQQEIKNSVYHHGIKLIIY